MFTSNTFQPFTKQIWKLNGNPTTAPYCTHLTINETKEKNLKERKIKLKLQKTQINRNFIIFFKFKLEYFK